MLGRYSCIKPIHQSCIGLVGPLLCVCKHTTGRGRGVWGHAPPEDFENLEVLRLLLRPSFNQYTRPDDNFTCNNIYPFCPLHRFWFSTLASHTLHRWGTEAYNCSLGRTQSCWNEDLKGVFHTVCSHLAKFNMSPMCLGALHGCPPSNGANWQSQASHW